MRNSKKKEGLALCCHREKDGDAGQLEDLAALILKRAIMLSWG